MSTAFIATGGPAALAIYSRQPGPQTSKKSSQCTYQEFADREHLLLAHLPQVRLVARSLWERTRFAVDLDDLIGYGILGLLDAVKKFDPSRGILLKTYAEHRIRGAILDGLRGMDWMSRAARKRAKLEKNGQSGNGSASAVSVDPEAGRMREDRSTQNRRIPPHGTTMFYGGGVLEIERLFQNAHSPRELIQYQPTPEHLLEHKQERSALAEAVASLPERQRNVLHLYYRQELCMKQIAVMLGVHESRVSQIHLAALTRLRKALASSTPRHGSELREQRNQTTSLLAAAG
jgi:RNA polymerase sigma factor for flagellar operon FliA